MKGLDTNVLVRYLVQDDAAQAKKAANIIKESVRAGEKLFLNLVVVCETIWVLESAYGYAKPDIIGAMRKVMSTKQFEFQTKEILWRALDEYANAPVDFADAVIGLLNLKHDCATTLSFDRALKRLSSFTLI